MFKDHTRKEIEVQGCISVPSGISEDEVSDKFIEFIEEQGWFFGGGFRLVDDGHECE